MPELTTEIRGLTDGTYDIWAFFWDGPDPNTWTLSAGLTSGALTIFSHDGPGDTAAPVRAGGLDFANPPVMTAESPRELYGVKLGQTTVSEGSNVRVFIDNLTGGDSDTRTWFDGVGYESVTATASLGARLLGIDFNRSDNLGAPSQSCFRIVSGSGIQGENSPAYTRNVGAQQMTVSQPNGSNFEFRGANGDSSRAIPGGDTSRSFLVSDFIATRDGAINLEITGLPSGNYHFRSYHLDTITGTALGFAQGASNTTANIIEASVGEIVKGTVRPTALGSAGLNTTFISDNQIPTLDFTFSYDGLASPFVIELRATQTNGSESFLLLNGFELFQSNP
ncbi:MAG: hypothetical protein WBG04_09745 [Haloferula sp.]